MDCMAETAGGSPFRPGDVPSIPKNFQLLLYLAPAFFAITIAAWPIQTSSESPDDQSFGNVSVEFRNWESGDPLS
jgi:hypothetical protein